MDKNKVETRKRNIVRYIFIKWASLAAVAKPVHTLYITSFIILKSSCFAYYIMAVLFVNLSYFPFIMRDHRSFALWSAKLRCFT